MSNVVILILVGGAMFAVLGGVTLLSHFYNLNNIKSKTVGDGQHGTARWATKKEIRQTYKHIPFTPKRWREQAKEGETPTDENGNTITQGIVVGCQGNTTALVDTGDVHVLMIGAAGVGKTAFWLYPCIEYACASGMSFLSTDTKGDVLRNYGNIAKDYGYRISVIDLRNPTRSNGNNLLHLVNKYMDLYQRNPDQLVYKAKCEKYAKIISKTIILSGMDASSFGQNAYFYDAAEGLLTATILLVAEFCSPEKRHIVSVFKIIQELLAPSPGKKGKNQFQQLMELLPNDHKAKWFAGAALNTGEQSMASVMSTVMSGSISRGKDNPSQSLQMVERALMTPDELKSLPRGDFIVMKTGVHPMRVHLKLFFKWGIEFDENNPYIVPENGNRVVEYADKQEIQNGIMQKYHPESIFDEPVVSEKVNKGSPPQTQSPKEIFDSVTPLKDTERRRKRGGSSEVAAQAVLPEKVQAGTNEPS